MNSNLAGTKSTLTKLGWIRGIKPPRDASQASVLSLHYTHHKNGMDRGNRTPNNTFWRRVLYLVELCPYNPVFIAVVEPASCQTNSFNGHSLNDGDDGSRTHIKSIRCTVGLPKHIPKK
jgi:hypothetical protein